MGRKLPTAYTSQQLLSGVGQSDIFFQFFCSQKLRKIASKSRQSWSCLTCRNVQNFMSRKSKNCTILDTKKSRFWTPEIVLFWTNPEKSRNLENLENLQKSQKSAKSRKISKIAKISKISKISTFWPSEGYHTEEVRIAIRRSIWPLWRTCPEGQICHPETKILDFPETKKSAKISKF